MKSFTFETIPANPWHETIKHFQVEVFKLRNNLKSCCNPLGNDFYKYYVNIKSAVRIIFTKHDNISSKPFPFMTKNQFRPEAGSSALGDSHSVPKKRENILKE